MSIKTTQHEIKQYLTQGYAEDLTYKKSDEGKALREQEGYIDEGAYSVGTYGCNGLLLKGHNTGKMYTITARTQAIYLV